MLSKPFFPPTTVQQYVTGGCHEQAWKTAGARPPQLGYCKLVVLAWLSLCKTMMLTGNSFLHSLWWSLSQQPHFKCCYRDHPNCCRSSAWTRLHSACHSRGEATFYRRRCASRAEWPLFPMYFLFQLWQHLFWCHWLAAWLDSLEIWVEAKAAQLKNKTAAWGWSCWARGSIVLWLALANKLEWR